MTHLADLPAGFTEEEKLQFLSLTKDHDDGKDTDVVEEEENSQNFDEESRSLFSRDRRKTLEKEEEVFTSPPELATSQSSGKALNTKTFNPIVEEEEIDSDDGQ